MQPQQTRAIGRSDGSEVQGRPKAASSQQSSIAGRLRAAVDRGVEQIAERIGKRQLPRVLDQRERVRRELRAIPERMQKTTNQAALVLELIDDYVAGKYREVPYRSLAIGAVALVYSVSPGDIVPDVVPLLGQLDDAFVISIAMRLVQKDLERYVRFKGYDVTKYF